MCCYCRKKISNHLIGFANIHSKSSCTNGDPKYQNSEYQANLQPTVSDLSAIEIERLSIPENWPFGSFGALILTLYSIFPQPETVSIV